MSRETAKRIVREILDHYDRRNGFEHWWEEVDSDIQAEILREQVELVEGILPESDACSVCGGHTELCDHEEE